MAVISDDDLQDLADLAEDLALKDECEILELQSVEDASGGHALPDWLSIATVKCAIVDDASPLFPQSLGQQVLPVIRKKILMPRGTEVTENNRIWISGAIYTINGIPDPTSYEVLRRVYVMPLRLEATT